MYKFHLVFIFLFIVSGCSFQSAEERFYSKKELFNKSGIYQADIVSDSEEVYFFLQARDVNSASDEKTTLMATIIELDEQTVLSLPVMVSPMYVNKLEKFQAEWCIDNANQQAKIGCKKNAQQIAKYYSALNTNQPSARFMDSFKIKGQQSIVFPSGNRKLKVLLYQSQWAGRGYLATFDIDNLEFIPGEYYFYFDVERGIGGYISKITAWVESGIDGNTLWQQVINK
ncbi:hypothetical protein SAMN05660691_03097 [Rheinheimera pacifica]|uniref:Lipoprotein n=1 Tax=Rheinheimera pacifica TaxID=173990 RepID=A0A1H6MSC2_9GAMM|nr:hypothetical protein [Rheinheimera pacifica]SEI04865.1 hypothetical protein SAMN05660691_03097 [Rheinheimera pacifica]